MILTGDCLERLKTLPTNFADSLVTDPPAGISFMGKDWDSDKGGSKEWIAWMREVMQECLRVMKPGAHGLVWAIPRTSHWTATACEEAGFEIRDVVTHLFGTGFPKSLDVSKAIDKAAGAEREVVGKKAGRYATPINKFKPNEIVGSGTNGAYDGSSITAPATDEAKKWSGFGTALKPACEMWILVRKPLSEKTVAANVLKWGTGGLNIDGSRIEGAFESGWSKSGSKASTNLSMSGGNTERGPRPDNPQGRFPANLVLSHTPYCTDEICDIECAIQMLDEQSGPLKFSYATNEGSAASIYGSTSKSERNVVNKHRQGDTGGASRFFYIAKASKSDKGVDNVHPTVKSTTLMRYLIKLVTPPGGTVLDPFMGSGSTGVAAKKEGFMFIGIEREQEYVEIATKRIEALEGA